MGEIADAMIDGELCQECGRDQLNLPDDNINDADNGL